MKGIRIGIDLGTTSTLVATLNAHRQPELLISRADGTRFVTPSIIHVDGQKAYVGQPAVEMSKHNPNIHLIQFFKRFFGKADPLYFDTDGNAWHPEGLAALMLKKVMFDVQTLGYDRIEGAVITVPAHFDESQKQTVLDAAALARLEVLDLIEEPLAAAMHYGVGREGTGERILVYDLGGGTFDVTVISTGQALQVLAKEGITDLGGKEFDDRMKETIVQKFGEATGAAFSHESPFDLQELARISEEFKKTLSLPGKKMIAEVVTLNARTVELVVTTAEFEQAIAGLVARSIDVCRNCLQSIGLHERDIHRVLLVGGSTFVPLIKHKLAEVFNEPWQQVAFHEPLRAVAYGAALHAHQLKENKNGGPAPRSNLTEYYYGIRSYDGEQKKMTLSPILLKNQPFPLSGSMACYKSRPEQDSLRFEISRYRENNLDPAQSEVEVLGEMSINGLANKPVHQRIDLKLELTDDGLLRAEAKDPLSPWSEKSVFGNRQQTRACLPAQQDLLEKVAIIGQV